MPHACEDCGRDHCPKCGFVHPGNTCLVSLFSQEAASPSWASGLKFTAALPASKAHKVWKDRKVWPYCRTCNRPARADLFLDYCYCKGCKVALAPRAVKWIRPKRYRRS